ncbi:glutamate-5-semialdehyde dehydrogenase [Marininema halotolerans]|uniref:Gamma-glutamyl phosphate reductase n=1 Tax=Marininema halotolerans TaxID=1155944 RepID=A0A1I6R469_9BACL|nr:glutamate-5-semialdehyde dehydrogenase [Marininema halotolerans]SFS59547.1 glutamate-5-semialdehyde dehydrogenase [Marininema halotolerans]
MSRQSDVRKKALLGRSVLRQLVMLTKDEKDAALLQVADAIVNRKEEIIQGNDLDRKAAIKEQVSQALLDRLTLTDKRVQEMAEGLRQLVHLDDPIGEVLETRTLANELRIEKVRVPLGVIGMIYEARPNVTVDAAGIALKTGNAILLRGSSSACHSNAILTKVIQQALEQTSVPSAAVQLVENQDRSAVQEMMTANGLIDVIIPRGGAGLIQRVVKESTVPVLETGVGNCHIYIHQDANPKMANDIVINAKTDRPAVCNAVETILVHHAWAERHLRELGNRLLEQEVEVRGCLQTQTILPGVDLATDADWKTEYLDRILAVKVVDSLESAITHIDQYGSHHSEAILTEDATAAHVFLTVVDAAAVYHNASTRFTDGGQFGFGAEIGISTQKLHARGPMGLKEMTSYQYRIHGTGQIRK